MKTRSVALTALCTPVPALAAVLVAASASCESGTSAGDPLVGEERVAEEIVNGLAQQYADLVYDGRVSAVTVDIDRLDALASFPVLDDGLRRVAEQSSADAWVLRFSPMEQAGGVFALHAEVIDPYLAACCVMVGAVLDQDADGEWLVKDFYHSGHTRETADQRVERIARRASR